MKRNTILAGLLILVLCLAMAIPAFAVVSTPADAAVMDLADLLSQEEELQLTIKLGELSLAYDTQMIIATVSSTDGGDADAYIEYLYDVNALGYGDDRSGILLLVCMDIREFRILTNGAANDAIGGYEIDIISDAIVSDLSDGNYAAAFATFADECAYYLEGHINGFPFDWGQNLVIALIIGLVAGLVTAFVLKAQLRSVRSQSKADAYIKAGSMQLTMRSDLFLYRHVTRTRKESNHSSRPGSRSGSSRSVGGRSF